MSMQNSVCGIDEVGRGAIAGPVIVASVVFLFVFLLFVYFLKGRSIEQVSGVFTILSQTSGIGSILYFFHCYAQEFLTVGVMQTGLRKLIGVENCNLRLFLAVCMASLAFGVTHTPFGFPSVFATFVFGIIFGYIYVRSRNLIGVTVFHYFSGTCFFALLTSLGPHPGI